MVALIQLKVPDDKVGVCDWLMEQTPEVVANVLELSQIVYKMNQMNVHISQNNDEMFQCVHEWEKKYKNVLMLHQNEMFEIVEKTKKKSDEDMNTLRKRNVELLETNAKEREYYKHQMTMFSESKDMEFKQLTKLMRDSQMENENLKKSITDLTKLFTGSASNTGIVGENLVHYTFNTLQLGVLDDLRYDSSPGCEDFLWSHNEMMCSVEVKNSKCLHSKHDMDKHFRRIDEAIQSSKINCALFLSLNARIPNMSAFDLQSHSGIPILYVSKFDGISMQSLIEISFRLMNVIWNINQKEDKTNEVHNYNNIFNDISSIFSAQLKNIASIDDSLVVLEKNTQSSYAQLQKLRKAKANLLSSFDNFYSLYPIMKPLYQDEQDQPMSESHNTLLKAILTFHQKRKKYPKEIKQIKCYVDDIQDYDVIYREFVQEFPVIVESIKKNKKHNISKKLIN